jgi:hypothetical protein
MSGTITELYVLIQMHKRSVAFRNLNHDHRMFDYEL